MFRLNDIVRVQGYSEEGRISALSGFDSQCIVVFDRSNVGLALHSTGWINQSRVTPVPKVENVSQEN